MNLNSWISKTLCQAAVDSMDAAQTNTGLLRLTMIENAKCLDVITMHALDVKAKKDYAQSVLDPELGVGAEDISALNTPSGTMDARADQEK